MKKLELSAQSGYRELLALFEQHLRTLGYSSGTVSSAVSCTHEFLYYLQLQGVELAAAHEQTANYFDHLHSRVNHRYGGGLKLSTIHKHRSALQLFSEYLQLSHDQPVAAFSLPFIGNVSALPKVLSKDEIRQLFHACGSDLLGKRNSAMLALYYGCGLRRQEAINLNSNDIDYHQGSVFIAKSKTHTQRSVPLSDWVQAILEDYAFNVREKLIPDDKTQEAFLVTERGGRLSKETTVYTFKKLLAEAKIKTPASLHTLRHSVATHLLQSGMKFENIALFLGHKSLDSTQLYTHLVSSQNT